MKIKELRIGNVASHQGKTIIITSIFSEGENGLVNFDKKMKNGIPIEELEPVKIPYGNPWKLINKILPTEYIHEIQNSYFYLKNEEINLADFDL